VINSPLEGRVAVVTGVSRRAGIGFAVAAELLAAGASVLVHSWSPHDAGQPWGADPVGDAGILAALGEISAHNAAGLDGSAVDVPAQNAAGLDGSAVREGLRLRQVAADFADPEAPARVIATAVEAFGAVDVVVANHARSSNQNLTEVTAAELDLTWAVNARASVLLTQAFAAAHEDDRPGGRVILFTSGQHLGPMSREIPYAVSKGAIHQMTLTLSDALVDRGITVNAVNPGPVDTGWADAALTESVGRALPAGRWGQPGDVARLIRWLASDDSQWITGQVINSEGGFRR
jgi:3-oxoacyl-[acyl-carrier protein] reductase